jgi:hypothetical protein
MTANLTNAEGFVMVLQATKMDSCHLCLPGPLFPPDMDLHSELRYIGSWMITGWSMLSRQLFRILGLLTHQEYQNIKTLYR